jgi:hypothetical protein
MYKNRKGYFYIGGHINLSRRNVELVKQITGGLLIVYVAIIVLTTILARDVLDKQTVYAVQTTLDLPTALTLVAYSILSIKLEFDKPKYRQFQRNKGNIDILLLAGGAVIAIALVYLKYIM